MSDRAYAHHDGGLTPLRQATRALLDGLSDADARRQFHRDLSPLAWHLGHAFFVETYWLREVVCDDRRSTAAWHPLFFPAFNAKRSRGNRLRPLADLLAWTCALERDNRAFWRAAHASKHPLMANDYLPAFLRQHYAQHLETMQLVHRQRALLENNGTEQPSLKTSTTDRGKTTFVPSGHTTVGSNNPNTYDNEQPTCKIHIAGFHITRAPVTNAEWLAFIDDGGYHRDGLWTEQGKRWRDRTGVIAPTHWRAHPKGGWMCPDPENPLLPNLPVHGICAHEADAFAQWAGARLAHEHELEYAMRIGAIHQNAGVWAWCANTLFPYPGFTAFPYAGYSTPWFDGQHRVLRGASTHTHPAIQRPTFRNFYPESHRHIRAGLRLAW